MNAYCGINKHHRGCHEWRLAYQENTLPLETFQEKSQCFGSNHRNCSKMLNVITTALSKRHRMRKAINYSDAPYMASIWSNNKPTVVLKRKELSPFLFPKWLKRMKTGFWEMSHGQSLSRSDRLRKPPIYSKLL